MEFLAHAPVNTHRLAACLTGYRSPDDKRFKNNESAIVDFEPFIRLRNRDTRFMKLNDSVSRSTDHAKDCALLVVR